MPWPVSTLLMVLDCLLTKKIERKTHKKCFLYRGCGAPTHSGQHVQTEGHLRRRRRPQGTPVPHLGVEDLKNHVCGQIGPQGYL